MKRRTGLASFVTEQTGPTKVAGILPPLTGRRYAVIRTACPLIFSG